MDNILTLFLNTAEKYAERKAIACGEQSYTFQQLKEEALALAATIRDEVGRQNSHRPVAVLVNRDADTFCYFLAVLFSGNYYVPIDPEMPQTKQRTILEDSCPAILLAGSEQQTVTKELKFEGKIFSKSAADFNPEKMQELEDSAYSLNPDTPAYMIYTSGSTGKPKGVLKSHKAVCSFIKAYAKEFDLGPDERIGNQTPLFFDASAKDLYLMVYTGASLEIIPSGLFMYPPKLMEYLNEKKITYICWVPTALVMAAQLNAFKSVPPQYLKKVFFVGEVFPIKQLRKWIAALPEITYVNLYGSTEIAGISCYYRVDTSKEIESLPMGKALSNCTIYLRDPESGSRIAEPEVNGEVCIISDALALEYFHDPEKTAAVFRTENGQRVLLSGDLSHYDREGNLVFASRKDFQIKLFGRRIELGEIETAADKVEEIQRCACIFDSEKQKIRMYCELIPGCEWTGRQVREELKNRLSDYMVPATVKIMEKLPLNANGKIDRTKLKSL